MLISNNKETISSSKKYRISARSKPTNIYYYFIYKKLVTQMFNVIWVLFNDNLAYILIKPLHRKNYHKISTRIHDGKYEKGLE